MAFKPSYTWPNPAFPFRIYYEGEECRIFIIENIQHNWNWLSEFHKNIRSNDFFFVMTGWYHDDSFAKQADGLFDELNLNRENFFILFNSPKELANFNGYGFRGRVIPHNAWLDENLVMKIIEGEQKLYDAIYIARLSAFKRHHLAAQVPNLALVAGQNHNNPLVENLPSHVYSNDQPLGPDEVCVKINQSRCGLLLSASEGGCFSSSEYLMCGIPVVSTISTGGRDVWYDEYNSIVVEPDEYAIKQAVEFFKENTRDSNTIRRNHIMKANTYRMHFVEELSAVFTRFGAQRDAAEYFNQTFMHKMRNSSAPDFSEIFPDNERSEDLNERRVVA